MMTTACISRNISSAIVQDVLPKIKIGQHALAVVQSVSRGNYEITDIQKEIEKDPGLTAATLSVANSVAFNPSYFEVKTVREACFRMGGKALIHAALFYYSQQLIHNRLPSASKTKKSEEVNVGLDPTKLGTSLSHMHWMSASDEIFYITQAERVGHLCMKIGYLVGEPESDLFTLGILHDIGLLVISAWDKMSIDQVTDHVRMEEANQAAHISTDHTHHTQKWQKSEFSVYGTDHAQVGAYFLEHINLPASVYMPVLYHNKPSEVSKEYVWKTLAVHLASCINYLCTIQEISGHPISSADHLESLLHACCDPAVAEHITFWKKQLFEICQDQHRKKF